MKNENYTPKKWVDAARDILGDIYLDPFSCDEAQKTVQAHKYFTKEDDALTKDWGAGTVFMNPPYSNGMFKPSIEKFLEEYEKYRFPSIVITNANYETKVGRQLAEKSYAICLPFGRINFNRLDGKKCNRFVNIVYAFNVDHFDFYLSFKHLGNVFFSY